MGRLRIKRSIFISILLVFFGTAAPATGQQRQGADPLLDICSNFLAQSGQGVSGDSNRLCQCLTRETQRRLTRREMELYSQATSQGQAPPEVVMQKVVGIATRCLAEAR